MKISDLNKIKHIHFTGIKGVGMTALALCVKDLGKKVTGSDVSETFVTDEVLKKSKIIWNLGFGENNMKPKPDLLVVTAAHGGLLNPEAKVATESDIPVKSYAEFMSDLANTKKVISVCGVGGKSTTASMISVLFDTAKLKPSYIVGVASIDPIGFAGRYEKEGKHFICEADDYVIFPGTDNTPKFMLLNPHVSVVTNIEYDHPDVFEDFDKTKEAFKKYFEKIPKEGVLIACTDNANVSEVIKDISKPILTYGINNKADFRIKNIRYKNEKTIFDLCSKTDGRIFKDISINVPGEFNVRNATAAFLVADFMKIDEKLIRAGLERYKGCRRRFEKMGEYKGASFYDDYAHHPSEVTSILKATRDWYPERRIVSIFQPHTFSRTKALFNDFSKSFKNADVAGFMDIYASARESFDATISSKTLKEETEKHQQNVHYLGGHKETIEWIKNNIKKGDIVLTMGAGDIFHLYENLAI